jgi:hypothetical protein
MNPLLLPLCFGRTGLLRSRTFCLPVKTHPNEGYPAVRGVSIFAGLPFKAEHFFSVEVLKRQLLPQNQHAANVGLIGLATPLWQSTMATLEERP